MDDWLVALGKKIRKIRLQKGISIRALAEQAGLDKNQLLRIEKGEANLRYLTLCTLADTLGTPISDMVKMELDDPQKE